MHTKSVMWAPCTTNITEGIEAHARILVCSALGSIPGVPKVHFKGKQGDYYVMVRAQAVCLPPAAA